MTIVGKEPSPERERTDESLRIERDKADRALAERHAVELDADTVVRRARDHADAVLDAARQEADQQLEVGAPLVAPIVAVTQERVVEDEALREERAAADETIRREREASARALAKLLPLERDRTDRFLMSERARSDDALSKRDDFMAIVSHDLRDLLGGIVMSATLLGESAPADTEAGQVTHERTKRILRYAARMNRLIGDLLDVSSIDAGKLAVTRVLADATPLIVEAVDLFREAASANGIALEMELAPGPMMAEVDHDRMIQVLANLITNAVKFTSRGGRVRVRCERAGEELSITVSDTGSGIPTEMLETVFKRFWQVEAANQRGVGLGLYISRYIIEAHGGRIWAESTPGAGSTLSFTLPAAGAGHAP